MSNKADIKDDYLEAVRLYIWYQNSEFSYFEGKSSKELSNRYRNLAHKIFELVSEVPKE